MLHLFSRGRASCPTRNRTARADYLRVCEPTDTAVSGVLKVQATHARGRPGNDRLALARTHGITPGKVRLRGPH